MKNKLKPGWKPKWKCAQESLVAQTKYVPPSPIHDTPRTNHERLVASRKMSEARSLLRKAAQRRNLYIDEA